MGYLDNSTIVVDAILTKQGRKLISQGNPLNISYFTLTDTGVDYTLWNTEHPSGSAYYGEAIENLPQSYKFDIILANISSNTIIDFSELIYAHLIKGGLLLCSGILSSDMDKTLRKLESSGFISLDSIQEEDWCCLELSIA